MLLLELNIQSPYSKKITATECTSAVWVNNCCEQEYELLSIQTQFFVLFFNLNILKPTTNMKNIIPLVKNVGNNTLFLHYHIAY